MELYDFSDLGLFFVFLVFLKNCGEIEHEI